jgi:cardiolipin synthase
MGILNIPNTFTITRIVIIPVFITAIIYKRYDYALYLFVIAAITDILDGLFARIKNQKTALGTFLDPIADKFLIVTSFIILATYGWIPKWLAITVISRDIIVVTGWFLLYLVTDTSRVEPSVLGKATIWIQSIFIAYVLIEMNFLSMPVFHNLLRWVTAGITITSGLHYIYRGLKPIHAI